MNFVKEKKKIMEDDSYYKMAVNYKNRRYNDFIREWSESAKSLSEIDINGALITYIPKILFKNYDKARKEFLKQSKKILSLRTRSELINKMIKKSNNSTKAFSKK